MVRHFLSINDFSAPEIKKVLTLAVVVKKNPSKYNRALKDKTLAMIFEKPSLRTRVSFEAGMTQLGGHAIYLGLSDREHPCQAMADILTVLEKKKKLKGLKLTFMHCLPAYNSIQEHSAVYCGDELNADMSSSFGGIPHSLERGGCHRGYEVTNEVIDGPQSVVFDEAENRLHAQKAIMLFLLGVD